MIARQCWVLAMALGALACRPGVSISPDDDAKATPPVRHEPRRPEPAVDAEPAPTPEADPLPAEPPPDAERLSAGVAIQWLERGDPQGPTPRRSDRLELCFSVWDEDDELVGASPADRSETLEATWLPSGWMLAMESMHEGDHARIWVPATLAYPNQRNGPRGALRIDVQLVAIERSEIEATEEVPLLAPPATALTTASGLAFYVLREGTGTDHPRSDSRVTVHYEGWTTDGNRFDSSLERGRPASFPLQHVIPGWQEAVPLMLEGEKTRFWIPAELAYGDQPGRPQGMLIFDIELISIDE